MLNDRVDYDKRSFISYQHHRVVLFKRREKNFKSNDCVNHDNNHVD